MISKYYEVFIGLKEKKNSKQRLLKPTLSLRRKPYLSGALLKSANQI